MPLSKSPSIYLMVEPITKAQNGQSKKRCWTYLVDYIYNVKQNYQLHCTLSCKPFQSNIPLPDNPTILNFTKAARHNEDKDPLISHDYIKLSS